MKILFVGSCQGVFLKTLSKELRKLEGVKTGVLNLKRLGSTVTENDKNSFDFIHEIKTVPERNSNPTNKNYLKNALQYLKTHGLGKLFLNLIKLNLRKINFEGLSLKNEFEFSSEYYQITTNYDIVNLHNVTNENLFYGLLLQGNTKLVVSLWGSDHFQSFVPKSNLNKTKLLNKAWKITVQNHDIKNRVCTKFGYQLFDKINVAYFLFDLKFLKAIQVTDKSEAKFSLGKELNIDSSKTWVSVGYKVHPHTRNLETVKEIVNVLSKEELTKYHFILPCSYSIVEPYFKKVKKYLLDHQLSFTIVNKYFTEPELAKFRKAIDIFIQVPLSDSYSATMIEHLLGQSYVIAGSWLPYSSLRIKGAKIQEVEKMEDIGSAIKKYDASMDLENDLLLNMFSAEQNISKWKNVFDYPD